jgi:serine/threonine protein kinase
MLVLDDSMAGGIVWCPHCKSPHTLGTKVCPTTAKTLERNVNVQQPTEARSLLIGTVIAGKYRIERLLGRGGTAEVYEAENTVLRRPVALKVLRHASSTHGALRLQREALLVAAIHHPNICDVYDAGALPNGAPFVVLERLSGETFASHLKHAGRLSPVAAADVFVQILSGLQRAHGANIVHRDLKPQNVFFVDRLGCAPLVKLLDFGLAKDLSETVGRSITMPPRMLVGTPAYMAPEQLLGSTASPRSDLFAVGIMLYEALTGKHPFLAGTLDELEMNVLRCQPRPPREVRRDLPYSIDALIGRALSRDPSDRWPTALAFQEAVKDALLATSSRWNSTIPPDSTEPPSAPRESGSDGHIPL